MKKLYSLIAFVIVSSLLLTACGARDVSTAFCVAEMTYNGEVANGGITWPGQPVPDLSSAGSYRLYIPCGYRNYIISDGKTRGPGENATVLGDRTNPILLSLPSGKVVETYLGVYWTLNQSEAALREFIKFTKKYNALGTDMSGEGNVYSSTPGWNNMLLENFSPTLEAISRQAMQNVIKNPPMSEDGSHPIIINDNMWKTQDTEQWAALANEMSRLFANNIAKRVGSGELDLFCGSNSDTGWENPAKDMAGKPGNKFNCAPVIIEVTYVQPANAQVDSGSQSMIEANRAAWNAAYELYHEQTDCWLGIQRTAEILAQSGSPVVIVIDAGRCNTLNPDGSQKPTTIVLPNNFTPTPEQSPTTTP